MTRALQGNRHAVVDWLKQSISGRRDNSKRRLPLIRLELPTVFTVLPVIAPIPAFAGV